MGPPSDNGTLSRRGLLKGLTAAAVGTLVGAANHGYVYERHRLSVTRETLPVSGLSSALSGLRIGLLTDLHRSSTVSESLARSAVEALMAETPDLIVLGGDYVTWGDRRFVGSAAEILGGLSAPQGIFAILGNHDDDRDMPAALGAHGIEVLRDARTRLEHKGESLDLAGVRYWTRRAGDIARIIRGSASNLILLAHNPARLEEASQLGIPLMLSGHTHGGQIVLPGLGAVAARKFPIIAGTGKKERTAAFVSRGVGTVYIPVRLNCPPEVAVLTLEPLSLDR
jgi:predicted MPP superfamily phosphohydrolase